MPTSLINDKKAVPKEFNRIGKRYDLATSLSFGYQEDLDFSASKLNLTGGERVLDLCCGTGKSSAAVLKHCPDIQLTGVDNSEIMLEVARQKFPNVTFELEDAMELSYPDESFDAIFMAYGLRNMPDTDKSLTHLYRLLTPGGRLVVHDYSLQNNHLARIYWMIMGYGFILPFCTVLTGSSRIFRYLVRSVLTFKTQSTIVERMKVASFQSVECKPHPNWRRPIQATFVAVKPDSSV